MSDRLDNVDWVLVAWYAPGLLAMAVGAFTLFYTRSKRGPREAYGLMWLLGGASWAGTGVISLDFRTYLFIGAVVAGCVGVIGDSRTKGPVGPKPIKRKARR